MSSLYLAADLQASELSEWDVGKADEQFHFDDISKHTNRVRERVLSGAQQNTADGLAHGILDSVVDAFFPLVRYVDGEVDDLDSLTIDPTVLPRSHARRRAGTLQHPTGSSAADVSGSNGSSPAQRPRAIEGAAPSPEGFAGPADADGSGRATAVGSGAAGSAESSYNDEKQRYPPRTLGLRERLAPRRIFPFVRPTRSSSDLPVPVSSADPYAYPSKEISRISFRRRISSCLPAIHINVPAHHWGLTYIRLFFLPVSSAVRQHPRPMRPAVDRNELLQRIVEVRRIVTGMTRMLGAKHQVVGRLRKRMEDGDLNEAAYVGDVEGMSLFGLTLGPAPLTPCTCIGDHAVITAGTLTSAMIAEADADIQTTSSSCRPRCITTNTSSPTASPHTSRTSAGHTTSPAVSFLKRSSSCPP